MSYGLSRNGYVPAVYERTDRRGIPWFGVVSTFVVGCVCFLPFPSWKSLVALITADARPHPLAQPRPSLTNSTSLSARHARERPR